MAAAVVGLLRAFRDPDAEWNDPRAMAKDKPGNGAVKTTWINIAQGVQAIATIIALIVGGLWAVNLYLQTREAYPKVVTEHRLDHVPLGDGVALLRAAITISNQGKTRLSVRSGNVRLQQIRPLVGCGGDPHVFCPKDKIVSGNVPVPEGRTIAPWPMLRYTTISPGGESIHIEPGEPDVLYYDFIVPSSVEVVQLYSFIGNEAIKGDAIWRKAMYYFIGGEPVNDGVGWKKITVHDLNELKPGGSP